MKTKLLAVALAAVMMIPFGACSKTTPPVESGEKTPGTVNSYNLLMATGGTSGTYYSFGGAIAQQFKSNIEGMNVTVQSTGASKENIRLVATGEAELAIVQNDVLDYAIKGVEIFDGEKVEGVQTIAALYPEIVQIIVAESSGITSIADLKGKKVSVGDAGSGVEANAKQILAAYGITFSDIKKENLSFKDSGDALQNNQIDAYFVTAGVPNPSIMDLMAQKPVKLLSVDKEMADKLIANYGFYTTVTIPKETYKTAEDVQTLAVQATLICSASLDEEAVYSITKSLFENLDDLSLAHAKGKEVTLEGAVQGVSVEFHPGATKYFTEAGVMK